MFKNIITMTPLTSGEAEEYFRSSIVAANTWGGDVTFITTLRALLPGRLKNGERVVLSFDSCSYPKSVYEDKPEVVMDNVTYTWRDTERLIHIQAFRGAQEDSEAGLKMVERDFEKFDGWHRVEKVTSFFRKVFHVVCFINPAIRSVALFCGNLIERELHYLQCGIPAFMPWYFDEEHPVTEEEMELIRSLREKTSENYEACISRIAERYDFNTMRIRALLDGFETRYERIQIENVMREISNYNDQINDLNAKIGRYLLAKRDKEIMLLGLSTKVQSCEGDSEIMEYFMAHSGCLTLKNVTDSSMEFVVKTTMDSFNSDAAKSIIGNERSYLYDSCNQKFTKENMRDLMTAVFVDKILKIQTCAAYLFNLRGNVDGIANYSYGGECLLYTPNPHIDRYNCMGDHKRIINEMLQENDFIGALEQSIESAKSLNFVDGCVMREFSGRICGAIGRVNMRCILLPDGRVVKPKEAVAWLEAQKKQNEEEVA